MCRAMPFTAGVLLALWIKTKFFFWRWYCERKEIEMWFIVVCTLIDNEWAPITLFPNIFSYRFCMLSLTRTSRSFAKSSACTFKSESVFFQIVNKSRQRFCAGMLQLFSPTSARRLLTSCVFLSHSETLDCENKIDKEFWLNQQNRNLFIRVD